MLTQGTTDSSVQFRVKRLAEYKPIEQDEYKLSEIKRLAGKIKDHKHRDLVNYAIESGAPHIQNLYSILKKGNFNKLTRTTALGKQFLQGCSKQKY